MHHEVWRRLAGSYGGIGPQVMDANTADISDLADDPRPALGTLAQSYPCPIFAIEPR
jgi:hypothetical protein